MCREDGDLSFVTAQQSADGLWAWPLLSAFTRMALEWVGRGGFVHVSGCTENVCGPGRAAYRGSLPRVRGWEIRRCVNYSVVVDRPPGTAGQPVGKPEAPPRVPDTRSAAPHGSLPSDREVHKAVYGVKSAKPPGKRSDGGSRAGREVWPRGGAHRPRRDLARRPRAVAGRHGRPLPSGVTEGTHTVVRPPGCASPL